MTAQSSQSVHHDQRTRTACRIRQILDITGKTLMVDTINERKLLPTAYGVLKLRQPYERAARASHARDNPDQTVSILNAQTQTVSPHVP